MKEKFYTARTKTAKEIFGFDISGGNIEFKDGSKWYQKMVEKERIEIKECNKSFAYDYENESYLYKKEWLDDIHPVEEKIDYTKWIGRPVWVWYGEGENKGVGIFQEFKKEDEYPFVVKIWNSESLLPDERSGIYGYKRCELIKHPGEIWDGWKELK